MRFIVIDGLDGAGKDTHALLIKKRYEAMGEKVILRSHPESDNIYGRRAKRALLGRGKVNRIRASVYYAMDVLRSVRLYNHNADTIIMVRYLGGVAYLPPKLGRIMYDFFIKLLPTSDYMFFLDVDPPESLSRIEKRDEKEMFENIEQLTRVRKNAMSFVKSWNIISTNQPIECTRRDIEKVLERLDSRYG